MKLPCPAAAINDGDTVPDVEDVASKKEVDGTALRTLLHEKDGTYPTSNVPTEHDGHAYHDPKALIEWDPTAKDTCSEMDHIFHVLEHPTGIGPDGGPCLAIH